MTPGTAAQFFDGQSAVRHDVCVALSEDRQALMITGDTLSEPLRWRLMDLRALSDTSDTQRLTVTRHFESDDESPRDTARLVVLDPDLIAWLHKTRPNLFRADVHPGTWRKVLTYTFGAIAASVLMLFVILPAMADTLAQIIPAQREVAFGRVVTSQMARVLGNSSLGELTCSNEEGEAALQAMLDRLTGPQEMEYEINLRVFDHGMINAFAAPGGHVVLLRGLLDKAEHPDEVAGVLAHEIAHVESRDATRHALRAAGSAGLLTMILGDFTGGAAIAVLGEHMISASYTREAEGLADLYAMNMLAAADVDATGFADFFEVIAELEGIELPAYLSTHPASRNRATKARDFAGGQGETTPVLTEQEWQALKGICD